jgi:hypothetical protein
MSRNASGTYTLPTGNPVVSGTDITVTWGNNTMNDIATEMTDSLSRSGKGGMLAPLTFVDGSVTVPGISWVSDANTGFYRIGADNMAMTAGGVQIVDYANNAFTFSGTTDTAATGPIFSIFRNSASPADADLIGDLRFDGEDSAGNKTTYASVSSQIDDVTNATEDGTLLVKTMTAGTLTTQLDISSALVNITPATTIAGLTTIASLKGTGAVTITDILDEDNMASNSATKLATQQSIKAYVDSSVGAYDTLSEVLANGNTSGSTDLVMTSGQKITTNTIDETTSASGVTIDSVLVKDSTVKAGTLTIGAGSITDSSGAITFGNENLTTTGNVDANGVEFDSLSGTGAVAITDIKDEDNMASNSATMLATQQSIKAYVDAQVDTADTLSEVLAIGNTSGSTDLVMTSGQKVTTNTIDETTAASGVTIDSVLVKDSTVKAGTLTIGGGTITDSSGAITFGNENLVTTGTLGSGALTATTGTFSGVVKGGSTTQIAPHANADNFVADSAGHTGMTILSGTASNGSIFFGDSGNNAIGQINYSHSDNSLGFRANGTTSITLDSAGDTTFTGSAIVVGGGTQNTNTTLSADADDFAVSNTGSAGMSIMSGSTNSGSIYFGDTDADASGAIVYNHSTNAMALFTRGSLTTLALTLDASQNATFAGDVIVPVGSVGSPSLTFSGDTDTGIYRRTANTINVATGGVQRLEIDSAGNAIFAGALTATTIAGTTGTFSGNVAITKAGDITTSVFDTTTGVAGSTRTLAEHYVQGKSNSGATVNFQNITYNSADATNGSEDGSQIHYQMLAGTSTAWLNVDGINATFAGEVSSGQITTTAAELRMPNTDGKIVMGTTNQAYLRYTDATDTFAIQNVGVGDAFSLNVGTKAATFAGAVSYAGGADALFTTDSGAADNTMRFTTTGAVARIGVNGSAGNRWVGSTAYWPTFGTGNAVGIEFATNNNVRFSIDSAGAATFAGAASFGGNVTHGSAAYVTLTDYGTSANSRIITGGTNTATGYLAVAQWNGSAYVNTVSFSGSDNATTFAGDALIGDSVGAGETGTLSLNGTSGSSRYANIKKNYDGTFGMYINASLNASEVPVELWGSTDTKYLGFDTSANATFAGNIIRKATPNGSVGGFAISDNGTGPIISAGDTGTTLNTLYDFLNGNGIVGKIQTNGSATTFVTSSDYRLKENVVTDWDATTRLKQLKPSRFNFVADADTTVDGFLAHEAQAVVPECVTGLKDAMKDEEYEVSAATGEVFTPAIEEVTTQSQVMETVETGSYVNLAGETIVETAEQGVTTETTETVVQRQDIDGVSTEVEVEVTTQVPTMETVITTAAVAETVHSTDVVQPETLADGQQWRETTAQVMATRSVPDHQGIDQSKLVPLLVKTIQELEARITALEA